MTLLIAMAMGKQGVHWIAIAINAGSLLSTLIHVVPILKFVSFGAVPPAHLSRLLWAMLPLIAGSLYLRIEPLWIARWLRVWMRAAWLICITRIA